MTTRELIKLIEKDGWVYKNSRGGHNHYQHPTKLGKVTIPTAKTDLPKGTVNSVLKQAGLK